MANKTIIIDTETDKKILECKQRFLYKNPDLRKIRISYNKILYEMALFFLGEN